jgi:biopolymer transport protein ExbD
MAAFALRHANRDVSAAINITPLVDVLLVLLVIFMLATPKTTQRLALLNASACRVDCPAPPEPVRLALKRTGELYWNGSAISRAELRAHLLALSLIPRAPALEIHPERGTRYEQVTTLLVAARNAEVRDIGVAPPER